MAAASLKDAFEAIGADFVAQRPGTEVVFNFAGSQQLAQQLAEGAPGDVFASANTRQMENVVAAERVGPNAPVIFARNRLVVALPADNPADIETLHDLARPGIKLVLAAEAVPAGQYALEFLAKASAMADFTAAYSPTVLSNVVSYETNVRSVLTKVALGEADAGIVYASDAPPGNAQVITLAIPDEINVTAAYPIAVISESEFPAVAQAFVDYVLSEAGQATLETFGLVRADADVE
jgi:molybdate transport system substrate-binding protein